MSRKEKISSLRMLEFFSGIGGMRCAVNQALDWQKQLMKSNKHKEKSGVVVVVVELKECRAYEINREANQVYQTNFNFCRNGGCVSSNNNNNNTDEDEEDDDTRHQGCYSVHTKLVEQLTRPQVANFDLWTMSPPCQPFTSTRFAKQGDVQDKRSNGFLALLRLLTELEANQRPRYIFLENVAGFVNSQARTILRTTLKQCHYSWKEYLLSPMQLGIPNHRTRYYILCENSDRFFDRQASFLDDDDDDAINVTHNGGGGGGGGDDAICRDFPQSFLLNCDGPCQKCIGDYLDDGDHVDWGVYGLDRETLSQPWASDLPLVARGDTHSHCFTAFYSRQLHKSTGSLLLVHDPITSVAAVLETLDRSDMTKYRIRKFTPTELLRIFGFPSTMTLLDLRLQTQYKLIGNSINVRVVSVLMHHLLDLE